MKWEDQHRNGSLSIDDIETWRHITTAAATFHTKSRDGRERRARKAKKLSSGVAKWCWGGGGGWCGGGS